VKRVLTLLALLTLGCSVPETQARPAPSSPAGSYSGRIGAATYLADLPSHWNGTLLLYSHGYQSPGSHAVDQDAGDPATGHWLLDHGYALAGSSYSSTGWALEDAFRDQVALLDEFQRRFGKPTRVIAWGHSLGGIISAGLVQLHPERFSGAAPFCGVLAGSLATWNGALDVAFTLRTLIDQNLEISAIASPDGNLREARTAINRAATTAAGRARLGLVAAIGHLPGWFDPRQPEPAPDDYASRLAAQIQWEANDASYLFAYRQELEARAGGDPSWNTGVDYAAALAASPVRAEAVALYAAAGLDLDADLARLNAAPRVAESSSAAEYLRRNIAFDGRLGVPVLTLHNTGDGLVVPENEAAYRDAVVAAGAEAQLRQLFVHRASHCVFTPAEQITALRALMVRVDSGRWPSLEVTGLNSQAAALGADLNRGTVPGVGFIAAPPAFVEYTPAAFPRPFDAGSSLP
jgi:dienelactone hydrolase